MRATDATDLTQAWLDPGRRHDAVLLFDVTNGNPNGDPDAGNQPRTNPLDMRGLVSDVAIKRKVRNYIAAARPADSSSDKAQENARYKVYVEEGVALNARHERAYTALGFSAKKTTRGQQLEARRWMCDNFFDVRLFGALMSTGDWNCGQVKGPVQIGFATSIDPVYPLDQTITRVAVTQTQELDKLLSGEGGKDREMGRKAIVPYGLYRAQVYYSPHFGQQAGVTTEDLALFWQALTMMWDLDRSSARADMNSRGLYVFSHTNPLGEAPAHKLLDTVRVHKVAGVEYPASFDDYVVEVPQTGEVMGGVAFSGNLA
ncbi:MAG: type I-C CRISPR-associated protein Cas7/Csd2 [Actinomycetota bacterium]|nr:type I-C CRISPR-associated protein Cas7/Csd2 [Actinomycetota bacterium]